MQFARVLLIAAFLSLPAQASCPVSAFGAEKVQTCARRSCGSTRPPAEIAGIKRGAYIAYVSLDLFTRMTNWLAVDIDRAELLYIQNYPARSYERLLGARKQEKEPDRVTVRRVGKDTLYTRRRTIPADKLGEIVCVANALWKMGDEDGQVSYATDIYTGLVLVDASTGRSVDGLGLLAKDAGKLEKLMQSLEDPDWDWWDVF